MWNQQATYRERIELLKVARKALNARMDDEDDEFARRNHAKRLRLEPEDIS